MLHRVISLMVVGLSVLAVASSGGNAQEKKDPKGPRVVQEKETRRTEPEETGIAGEVFGGTDKGAADAAATELLKDPDRSIRASSMDRQRSGPTTGPGWPCTRS